MGGRPMHSFWKNGQFQLLKNDVGHVTARCLICNRELKNTAKQRLVIHRKNCPINNCNITATSAHKKSNLDLEISPGLSKRKGKPNIINVVIKNALDSEASEDDDSKEVQMVLVKNSDDSDSPEDFYEIATTTDPVEKHPNAKERPTTISSNAPKCLKLTESPPEALPLSSSNQDVESTNIAFTEFIISSNVPLTALKSTYLKDFVTKLNAYYKPPTLNELATTYLDKVYEKHKPKVADEKQDAVLLLSGWKNFTETSKCIVACLYLKVEGEGRNSRIFLNSWDLEAEIDSGEIELASKIFEESQNLAKVNYNAEIYAVVSDNPQLHSILSEQPQWSVACHSYLVGLLAEEIIDENDAKVVKQILQQLDSGAIESERIVLPSQKRWCTYRDSFQCYAKYNTSIRNLIEKDEFSLQPFLWEHLFDDAFTEKIRTYLKIFDPICKLIYLSQKKNTNLAEMVEEWIRLSFPADYQIHLEMMRSEALSPCALAAYYLHPAYRGRNMNGEQMKKVDYFLLESLDSPGLDQLLLFKRNNGIFKILVEKKVLSFDTFWSLAEQQCLELATLAKKIFCIPVSISYVDKIFSNWLATHATTRNLLGVELYGKLTRTHFLLNLTNECSTRYVFKNENSEG